jgi:hypothetical protein
MTIASRGALTVGRAGPLGEIALGADIASISGEARSTRAAIGAFEAREAVNAVRGDHLRVEALATIRACEPRATLRAVSTRTLSFTDTHAEFTALAPTAATLSWFTVSRAHTGWIIVYGADLTGLSCPTLIAATEPRRGAIAVPVTGCIRLAVGRALTFGIKVVSARAAALARKALVALVTCRAGKAARAAQTIRQREVRVGALGTLWPIVPGEACFTGRRGQALIGALKAVFALKLRQAGGAFRRCEVWVSAPTDPLMTATQGALAVERALIAKPALIDDCRIVVVAVTGERDTVTVAVDPKWIIKGGVFARRQSNAKRREQDERAGLHISASRPPECRFRGSTTRPRLPNGCRRWPGSSSCSS